jgi:hypothetical protein
MKRIMMLKLFKKLFSKYKRRLKISYYKISVSFNKGTDDLRNFIEVAQVLNISAPDRIALAITGKYLEGLPVRLSGGSNRLNKAEAKYFYKKLKKIEGIKINVIKGIDSTVCEGIVYEV